MVELMIKVSEPLSISIMVQMSKGSTESFFAL